MLLLLADHPQEWEEFRNDRTRASKLVEETLRLSTVLQAGLRVARTGAKVGDTEIPEGASVIPFLASANRDPSRFEYPSEFRPERRNSSGHLTFSHGLHTCPGNTIVRAEADVLLNAMADRWAKIEVIDRDKIEYEPSFLIRSVKKLHVRVTPAA
jgi:cytochrome P450